MFVYFIAVLHSITAPLLPQQTQLAQFQFQTSQKIHNNFHNFKLFIVIFVAPITAQKNPEFFPFPSPKQARAMAIQEKKLTFSKEMLNRTHITKDNGHKSSER